MPRWIGGVADPSCMLYLRMFGLKSGPDSDEHAMAAKPFDARRSDRTGDSLPPRPCHIAGRRRPGRTRAEGVCRGSVPRE